MNSPPNSSGGSSQTSHLEVAALTLQMTYCPNYALFGEVGRGVRAREESGWKLLFFSGSN